MQTMEQAQKAIDELQEKCGVAQFEDLLDKHQSQQLNNEEIQNLMASFGLDDEDVENDLQALENELAQEDLPDVPNSKLPQKQKPNKQKVVTN